MATDKNLTASGMGILAIGAGATAMIISPQIAGLAKLLMWIGSASIVWRVSVWSKYDQVFRNCKLGFNDSYPLKKRRKWIAEEQAMLYEFTLPAGLTEEDFAKHQKAIEEHIGKEIEIKYGFKNLVIKEYNQEMRTNYTYEPFESKHEMELPIGYNRFSKFISINIAKGEPHLLIAGESGGGKSTILRAIIAHLVTAQKVVLSLIDLKGGIELNLFEDCKNVKEFAWTEAQADETIARFLTEMNRRYTMFRENKSKDIDSYRKNIGYLPYEVLIIDEFALLPKRSMDNVRTLSAQARAAGMFLIICTQRPDRTIIDGAIKCNLTNVVGLKCNDNTNSRIIIDQNGLEALRGKGHGLLKTGGKITEFQAPKLEPEEAAILIAPYIREEQEKETKQLEVKNADWSGLEDIL